MFEGFVAKDASQDVVVELGAARDSGGTDRSIASPEARFSWVNVDDRFTIAYSGSGSARYENPHHFPVWHAVHDDLMLCPHDHAMDAEPGQVVCEMLAVWVPEHPHSDAAAAIPVVETWDADGLTARVGRWKVECSVPEADARSARITIEGA